MVKKVDSRLENSDETFFFPKAMQLYKFACAQL